ncbi:MAG: Periplasmic binding protein-like domain, partial [Friedmanniella sp.]|nr:Periplasmic binding protein-like domain [Friedmanniella sp.]
TIRQPVAEIATRAADLLVDLLAGRERDTQVEVATTLVPRGTTGRPRTS